MATLIAIKFPTVGGADSALKTLEHLQKQELIRVQDAAVVTWEAGKDHPKTRQVNSLVGAGALGGMFWGMLFGLIFFIPVIGAAVGLGIGALAGSLAKSASTRTSSTRSRAISPLAPRRSSCSPAVRSWTE